MHKLLLLLALVFGAVAVNAQVVLETFEDGGPDLTWTAVDGIFDGSVTNPNDSTSNPSAFVGSYTKAGTTGFSLFFADLAEPLDLSVNNEFSIQVNAGAATQLLMKLEGGGESIERMVNIPLADQWRTYTFDFSAAAGFTGINRIVLFFDPGVEESADTYLFDNITANPAGRCAGTVADPIILDNFECQRNVSYSVGFDDVVVIDNPDASGINTSPQVGQYTDRDGGFNALIIDYNDGIDLSVNNRFCMKVWAPVAGEILLKLEGGVSPPFEAPRVAIAEDEIMTWVEVCGDFSSQAAADHENLVLFFNVGVDEAAGDIYYIDDLTLAPAPPAQALEDFEDGALLGWAPLNNNTALHGTFNGPIPNPDMEGNSSANVGSYVRGSSNFSTLTAFLLDGLDLSANPQLNLDVWAPEGASSVTLQLRSAIDGPRSISANIKDPMTWQTLSFNFEEFADVEDFGSISILFDPETTGTGLYYFDNLVQGQSTVDACADVPLDDTILDNFECQRNANYTVGTVNAINNPDLTPANTSTGVGEFVDPPGAFNALVVDFGAPIDLSLNNRFQAKIWAPVEGQILFKLEGGTAGDVETFVDIPATMEWVDYEIDFSASEGGGYTRLVMFFGAGTDNAAPNTYFLDDLQFARAPYVNDCVVTFEEEDLTITSWQYFANGMLEGNDFIISDNPRVGPGNPSAKVGTFEKAADGEFFAGMFADSRAPVVFMAGNKFVKMKVLMDVAGEVVFKLEGGPEEMPQSGDIIAMYTTPNEWQELTFDMSVLPDDTRYDRFVLILNSAVVAENATYFFDDIVVGDAACGTVGLFNPVNFENISVYPNPVNEILNIDNGAGANTFELINMTGQRVRTLTVDQARTQVQWNVADVPRGTYVLTARNANGLLVARTRIVRN
ncbi:T9SS type A sorting domain-containing protein [Lewinella sp. 4G2]|uniref:T9SS type A sorting domain-containing protein n=1 Tax=Lewinella sp. 4G2 TaxID=1803372 RepID=UPI0007B4605F|nr:T9SS type A sorting domain-containing protein [Lewinella sp. 4G2]OAV42680.1 hypothetical protein A3850_015675 [Lewinella sp. 4G2]